MKNFLFLAIVAMIAFTACKPSKSAADYSTVDNASYALGLNYANKLSEDGIDVDFTRMDKAMADVFSEGEVELDDAQIQNAMKAYFKDSIKTDKTNFSYALGHSIAKNLSQMGFDGMNLEEFKLGRKAFANKTNMRFELTQVDSVIGIYQKDQMEVMQAKRTKEAEAAKVAGLAFLAENTKKEGVVTTATGLQYKVLNEGTGKQPSATDQVTVHYVGKLLDGTTFDSSVDRGQPATFPLNGVIPGWTEGVQLMKEGAKYQFYIPSGLAYGEQGAQTIPGNATLIFDVELIKVMDAPAPPPPMPQMKK